VPNRFKDKSSVLLIFPPGWSLNYGAPHIGLPLIKNYLNNANIDCEIKDLNIESVLHYNIRISENEVLSFKSNFNTESSYDLYFSEADKLEKIAKEYNGEWKIKSGFVYNGCDLASSEDIKEFSKFESPFTEFYKSYLIPEIAAKQYSIIGISVTVPSQLLSAFEISRIIRNSGYTGLIVLGGNTITRLKDELYLDWVFNIVDCIVLNQGEETLKLIFESIIYKNSFENIPNLLWKSSSGINYNGFKKLDVSHFSMPDFNGYPVGKYWGVNYLPMISARGCYYSKCKFCSIPFAWGNNGFVGLDNPNNVFECLQNQILEYSINNFSFVEETMHPQIIQKISQLILNSGIKIKFEGYIRFEKIWLDDSFLSLLSKAGLKKVFIGMELILSDNRTVLNKKDNVNQIIDYFKQFQKHNIKIHLFTLFGFPGTNEYDAINTVDFLLNHSEYIDTIDVSHFVYSKHTKINGIKPIFDLRNDWALEYDFTSENENDFNSDKAKILANGLESIIIQSKPQWTHPIYRMYSTWQ